MAQFSQLPGAQPGRKSLSFYNYLDEDKSYIRLISILPEPTSDSRSLVHCTIEQVSLLDFCVQYEQFLSTYEAQKSPRKLLQDWIKAKCSNSAHQAGSHIYPPDQNLYRYTWGDYETLSYTWGDPNHTSRIVINGQDVRITFNLEAALRSLRTKRCFEGRYRLWVDAICINQEDMQELTSQVKNMRQIYATSFASVAWLGEGGTGGKQALDLLDKLASFHDSKDDYRAKDLVIRLKNDLGYLGTGCWDALCHFFARDYWSRLWVIQEIVLSSPDMVLHCGSHTITWQQLCLGLGIVHQYLWGVKDACLLNDRQGMNGAWWPTKNLHKVWKDLYPISQLMKDEQPHLSFKQLLEVAAASQCSDARDKVYGLLALMSEELATNVTPNYEVDEKSVFISVAKAYISEYQKLDILRDGGVWGSLGTPSWVPDWTWPGRVRDNTAKRGYDASGDISMTISFSINNTHRLTCTGTIIDTLDGIGAAHIPYGNWQPESIVQPTSTQSAYNTLDGTKDALARTLYGDRASHGDTSRILGRALLSLPRDAVKAVRTFQKLHWENFSREIWTSPPWSEWRAANSEFLIAGQRFDDYFEDEELMDSDDTDVYDAYMSWVRTHHGRRLITTKNGYIGWVPDKRDRDTTGQVVPGDIIAIVYGCNTPLVLRKAGDAYRIIGEGYLQGLMEGEVLGLLASGTLKSQDLVLF
jgi:hypothetical protein